jgi:AcrR family transcriptional regulator
MSREPQPRRHHHLSRESIARSALELIDRDGIEAFSVRKLAASLHVKPANLYPYAGDRESVLRDVLALLLEEIDLTVNPNAGWESHFVTGFLSLRAMALRHPRAFPLVVLARYDQWPLEQHMRTAKRSALAAGVPPDVHNRLSGLIDAYAIGALTLETQVLTKPDASADSPFAVSDESALELAPVNTDVAFEEDVRTIIAGFKTRNGMSTAPTVDGDVLPARDDD